MPRVVMGYGDHQGYLLAEVPHTTLDDLASRFPLVIQDDESPEWDDLVITVAVHAEIRRRQEGGSQRRHMPSLRKLAEEIVRKGFQQSSKSHHPDGTGHHEAQVALNRARDELMDAAGNLIDDVDDRSVISIQPPESNIGDSGMGVDDDDVPF